MGIQSVLKVLLSSSAPQQNQSHLAHPTAESEAGCISELPCLMSSLDLPQSANRIRWHSAQVLHSCLSV